MAVKRLLKFFPSGVFGISHVHVADDIDDAAVSLFGEAFVLATVARFHVENRIIGKGEESPSLQPQQAGSYATLSSGASDAGPATPRLHPKCIFIILRQILL